MKRLVVILGLAVLHFVATVVLIVVSLGMGLERFDAGTWPPTVGERMVGALADVMVFPVYGFWQLLPYPWVGILELPLLFLNSLLWGTALYLTVLAVVRRTRRPVAEGVRG